MTKNDIVSDPVARRLLGIGVPEVNILGARYYCLSFRLCRALFFEEDGEWQVITLEDISQEVEKHSFESEESALAFCKELAEKDKSL